MLENFKTIKSGEIFIRQGTEAKSAYIIESGQVEVQIQKQDGTIQVVGTRGPGSIIGEMALIDDAPRTASVVALGDCRLLEITRDDFLRRLTSSDQIMQAVMRVLMTRYRDTLTRSVIVSDDVGYPDPEALERQFLEEAHTLEGLIMENEFKEAMSNGQLSLNYQPIVSLSSGEIVGFEALMRWNHPEKGFISPAVFIPMAEQSGLIIEASKWALRESCGLIKKVNSLPSTTTPKYVSVNFSSKDIAEDNFLEGILATLKEIGVSPTEIQLEITESLLMSQPERAKTTLNQCRELGLKIAIDDFGTGYSSLSYLHNYPINALKIDQAFIRNLLKDPGSLELCKSIITLGDNLHMTTIAEGIEGKEEGLTLLKLGCDTAQGYYFAKPLPENSLFELLATQSDFKAKLA